ncbi:amino acid/amide ABC transporter ATP-binding protein 2 (HAAT family) [Haloactinopolyspora alba]|uniref:Amino acid/amide ABC transporter ATP-binding protein 2 (HAAT family) n=1 Tax=Haloactinopolyspora alba TaxID=648780 RepID=A0A2P8DZU8_9ACTN|nr:ABC transporter ATP-binding protein [Haloactinopolyspora alba]PSL02745.1 amino acid/amide ABC transporter ATP-binding protein 2 (HAAT family) [Haloactinopolyspora alba]
MTTDASPALQVDDLVVAYGRVQAVRGVSFTVPSGGLVALVGANGAGKSSILNALAGLVRPRSGSVRFGGRDVTRRPAHELVAAGLVQVPEGREVLATMTVDENLRLGAWHRRSDADERIDEMYGRFPVLAERRALQAGALSGGEQQMLAIARALVAGPSVLLMDEPSMGLAPKIVDEVFAVIAEIQAAGTTVVLVEQNARRALRAATYGYVLESGTVAHEGPADDLLADRRVIQAYLGIE